VGTGADTVFADHLAIARCRRKAEPQDHDRQCNFPIARGATVPPKNPLMGKAQPSEIDSTARHSSPPGSGEPIASATGGASFCLGSAHADRESPYCRCLMTVESTAPQWYRPICI